MNTPTRDKSPKHTNNSFILTTLLLLLSCFSGVRLCVNPEMAAHQAPPPWDSPGKNTGVGCHFLLQCMKVKSESEVVQSCLTLCDRMDCSLTGSSIHGIFQARVLEWGAIAFSDIDHISQYKKQRTYVILQEFYSFWSYVSIFNPFCVYFCVWCQKVFQFHSFTSG